VYPKFFSLSRAIVKVWPWFDRGGFSPLVRCAELSNWVNQAGIAEFPIAVISHGNTPESSESGTIAIAAHDSV